jgi:hypothetical protein
MAFLRNFSQKLVLEAASRNIFQKRLPETSSGSIFRKLVSEPFPTGSHRLSPETFPGNISRKHFPEIFLRNLCLKGTSINGRRRGARNQ